MKNRAKKVLKEEIREIKRDNIEELFLMTKYFIEVLLKTISVFGISSKLTKDAINHYRDFKKNLDEEKVIYNFLLKNASMIDYIKCLKFLSTLDEINEKTVKYYYELLENIIDACELMNPDRIITPGKDFQMIFETDFYKMQAYGLTLNLDDIKKFLDYPEEFWKFVKSRTKEIDDKESDSKYFYTTLIRADKSGFLTDFLVIVPKIVDLKTAFINVHEFTHAYDLYNRLNTIVYENDPIFEKEAEKNELLFSNSISKKL